MSIRRVALLVVFCVSVMIAVLPALAQSSPLVAFVNSGGQLIVSSGDGSYRWIVTNPGETLVGDVAWSPAGDQVFFAVNAGGVISLRTANIAQQSVGELGQAAVEIVSISPGGDFAFGQHSDGSYGLQALDGSSSFGLSIRNDLGARYSGLWSDVLPLVAYWGYTGNSNLAVTDAASTQTALVDSGRTSPILPLTWLAGTAQLIYRDADGSIRLADFSCLQSACSGDPAEFNVRTLASADADIATDGTRLYFRSADSIAAVDLSCASADNCLNSAFAIAANAAPQTALNVAGDTLVYTAYTQYPNDPNDREVRVLNLACISSGSCAAQTVASGASAGAVAADGRYAVVESANGLESLDLTSGARAYLSDRGALLNRARWQS